MKSLERQKRIFIAVSLAVPMILLVGFIMVPAFDLFRIDRKSTRLNSSH